MAHCRRELSKAVVGQQELINQCLVTLLCGGHALIEGVPGIGKTLIVKLFSRTLALDFQRVQGTSDMMPSDILGSNIFVLQQSEFRLHKGPIFTDFLLVDEINRMPPRTQAALLESMEERQVTIDGVRHSLPNLFCVFATQNPVEFEGTYPLPEAQLDRFLLKIAPGYPEATEEEQILLNAHAGFDSRRLDDLSVESVPPQLIAQSRDEIRAVDIEPALFSYIVSIVRRTRDWPTLSLGASPRATISLMSVAKALAAIDGRAYTIPDDIKRAALPVLRHRIVLKPEAELEGLDRDFVITEILNSTKIPK